jgi:plasmid stability protein
MTRIVIDIPNDAGERIRARAAESGHASVEAYVRSLVLGAVDVGPSVEASVGSDEELERLLEARYDDDEGSFVPDDAFYNRLRARAGALYAT